MRINQNPAKFKGIIETFSAAITNDNIKTFLKQFSINFKELNVDSEFESLKTNIETIYNFISNTKTGPDFKKTLENFSIFAHFELRDIFNHLDKDNDLFKKIDEKFLNIEHDDYYKYFFDENTEYEENISIIYKKSKDRELIINDPNLGTKIIINKQFNFKKYGTVKQFVDSFIEIIDSNETDQLSTDNVVIIYILMTDLNIENNEIDILTKQIKTENLKNINFEKKITNIQNLLKIIVDEISSRKNIKNEITNYITNLEIPEEATIKELKDALFNFLNKNKLDKNLTKDVHDYIVLIEDNITQDIIDNEELKFIYNIYDTKEKKEEKKKKKNKK